MALFKQIPSSIAASSQEKAFSLASSPLLSFAQGRPFRIGDTRDWSRMQRTTTNNTKQLFTGRKKKTKRRRPTNERDYSFFFHENWMLMIRPFFAKRHSSNSWDKRVMESRVIGAWDSSRHFCTKVTTRRQEGQVSWIFLAFSYLVQKSPATIINILVDFRVGIGSSGMRSKLWGCTIIWPVGRWPHPCVS